MTPVRDLSSTLEDTHPGAAAVAEAAPVANYFWPVWRYGRVLLPRGAEGLPVADAQQIGPLFEPGRCAAVRYLNERPAALKEAAAHAGGVYLRDWPEHLRFGSEPFARLEEMWLPEQFLIIYSFVPIIRFPRFIVEVGKGSWQVRESLTICGSPAKSKTWLTASLVAYRGKPADSVALDSNDLGDARGAFGPFAHAALDSLVAYYREVLNEDTKDLPLEAPLHIRELATTAETEIVSLASGVDLGPDLALLEEKGFQWFRSAASQGAFSGAQEALDFLNWTDSLDLGPGDWRPGRPKILVIYAENPDCAVRALLIPRIDAQSNRTWYAALTERRLPEKPPSCFPLSESAGRFLAREYGRFF